MTFTYTGLQTTLLDKVRTLIGDTSLATANLSDEQIAATATRLSSTDEYVVALACAHMILAKYRLVAAGDHVNMVNGLIWSIKQEQIRTGAVDVSGYVGGSVVADNETAVADTSAAQPKFKLGGDDNA